MRERNTRCRCGKKRVSTECLATSPPDDRDGRRRLSDVVASEFTASAPCFHSANGTACSTNELPRDRALRRPLGSDGPRPNVTQEPPRRISRLGDKSPSQPANPRATTDRSRPIPPSDVIAVTLRRCFHHHGSPVRPSLDGEGLLTQANHHSPRTSSVATAG